LERRKRLVKALIIPQYPYPAMISRIDSTNRTILDVTHASLARVDDLPASLDHLRDVVSHELGNRQTNIVLCDCRRSSDLRSREEWRESLSASARAKINIKPYRSQPGVYNIA
jgi:hypothetical protein